MDSRHSDTRTTRMGSSGGSSLWKGWKGSLRRDHIALEDLTPGRADEGQQHSSSRSPPSRGTRHSFAWPFHGRNTSEVPSTTRSSRFTFRPVTWQHQTFFRPHDDTASIAGSIVPDYVVNFLRGETPETLARKKEQRKWGERDVVITPRRDTFTSHLVQFGNLFSSSSNLDLNGNSNGTQQSGLRRHFTGWRGGVVFNTLLAFVILVVGIICLILAIAETKLLSGQSALYSGDCAIAKNINMGLHVVINVFAVILLASANYVFQVLSSPTRRELTQAHANKRWLDIGIPSLRNFAHISGFRTTISAIVLLTAVATQVIYNSVIFTTQNALNYDTLFVTQSFIDHAPFSNDTNVNDGGLSRPDILTLQDAASQDELMNMTVEACLDEFGGAFETNFDAVLLVTDSTSIDSSLIQTSKPGTPLSTSQASTGNSALTAPDGSLAQYCLARLGAPQSCSVNLSGSVLGIVMLLNLATVIGSAVILTRASFDPLATLGDSVRSFLRSPDPTTMGACLLTKNDVQHGHWDSGEAKHFAPINHFWFQTPSLLRWALTTFAWVAIVAPAAYGLAILILRNPNDMFTSFGAAAPYTTFFLPTSTESVQMALLAATPQLLLAILYLVANSHLTTYFLSHEFSLFALGPRALRVSSNPAGYQTTSLYLTLPRPVSWILLATFAAMGFVLSQAVFPTVLALSSPTSPSARRTAISFSTQALLALLALLTILALVILGLGLRRTTPAAQTNGEARGNPLALRGGSCSAVISAKCHLAAAHGEGDLWLRPLAWGVVEEGSEAQAGRCAFSGNAVGCIDVSRGYA
ncbi:hypothetical protein F5B20DRAFT_567849 [Whalleya microplaca]|nr:hypothetical protein F5B20DRAFT_567849 [Whalleya microplaca]